MSILATKIELSELLWRGRPRGRGSGGVKFEGALGLDLGGVMWRNEGEYDKNIYIYIHCMHH